MAKRTDEVRASVKNFGVDETARRLGIKRETVRRYMRRRTDRGEKTIKEEVAGNSILKKIQERFSPAELKALADGAIYNTKLNTLNIGHKKKTYKMGIMTDTHLGSKYTNENLVYAAFDKFKKEKVDGLFIAGDLSEGMSTRPGHVYELSHIGYEAQRNHCIDVFSKWKDTDIYVVSGNHDRWFIKAVGANIVGDVAEAIPNMHFLGHDEGDVDIMGVSVKIWHGEDGSSYSHSYRLQKIIEAFTGGEKPQILICGHTHKAMYIFDRNIHCISAGAIQSQSKWMRSKKLASHTGFWIVEFGIDNGNVSSFKSEWFPAYI